MDACGYPLSNRLNNKRKQKKTFSLGLNGDSVMFPRLAEHYRSVVEDLVMSLQALASSLQSAGFTATCYSCGDCLLYTSDAADD